VFASRDCPSCEPVHEENIQAIAAKIGCKVDARYFDADSVEDFRKLAALESKYGDTDNEVPVVFIGAEVLGGEIEVMDRLELTIAKYAAEGGTNWPDEIISAKH
jgi:hypothetical protein